MLPDARGLLSADAAAMQSKSKGTNSPWKKVSMTPPPTAKCSACLGLRYKVGQGAYVSNHYKEEGILAGAPF